LKMADTPEPLLESQPRGRDGNLDMSAGGEMLVHCGDCNKCRERREAFHDAGVEDRTRYAK